MDEQERVVMGFANDGDAQIRAEISDDGWVICNGFPLVVVTMSNHGCSSVLR
ncbi:hypothetical protein ACLOJK_031538 [Asimina triloba]